MVEVTREQEARRFVGEVEITTLPGAQTGTEPDARPGTSGRRSEEQQPAATNEQRARATQWLSTAKLLEQKHRAIQAGQGPSPESADSRQFRAEREQEERELTALRKSMARLVTDTRKMVQDVLPKIHSVQCGRGGVDLEKLEEQLAAVEQHISATRAEHACQYHELQEEEERVSSDLDALTQRINGGEAEGGEEAAAGEGRRREEENSRRQEAERGRRGAGKGELLPEVVEFDAFEELHGSTGGWHPDDASQFERILGECGGDYGAAVQEACRRMLGISRSDALAHARWHAEYAEMWTRKRVAIAEWRAARDAQGARDLLAAMFQEPSAEELEAQAAAQRDWRLLCEVKREAVAAWKAQKQQQQQQARAAAEAARRSAKDQEARRRQARQDANRARLEEYRQHKERLRRQQELQQLAARPRTAPCPRSGCSNPAAPEWEVIRMRSAATLQRREQLLETKRSQQQQRSERQRKLLEKVQVRAEPDASRVLRPTQAVQLRRQATALEERGAKDSLFIRNVQHKAAATWHRRAG